MQQAAKTGSCIAALVILRGPDPKKAKAADTAFHKASDGVTTLSCSGIVTGRLGQDCAVLVPVTAVLPFIQQAGREQLDWRDSGVLLSNVRISVAWRGLELEAKLQGQVQVAGLQSALEELLESGTQGWRLVWGLASSSAMHSPAAASRLAVLQCKAPTKEGQQRLHQALLAAEQVRWQLSAAAAPPGTAVVAVGSPFGVLSPSHFSNNAVAGIVSNSWFGTGALVAAAAQEAMPAQPQQQPELQLLMTDLRGLPGMEGCPVMLQDASLLGVLMVPLFSTASRAEVPLVIPAGSIWAAWHRWLVQHTGRPPPAPNLQQSGPAGSSPTDSTLPVRLAAARSSVVAVQTSLGTWASGVVLNQSGLLLTNAHLLHGRASKNPANTATNGGSQDHGLLMVRLNDSTGQQTEWRPAEVVYVFAGYLDIALLRLRNLPSFSVRPMPLSLSSAAVGQSVYVIGHALLSPHAGLRPTVTSGHVAQVVSSSASSQPSMLLTTATVHPGASGGAVLEPDGSLIGLVTSNARHSKSGSTIPNLNFVIAAKVLAPIWHLATAGAPLSIADLQMLDVQDPALTQLWALASPEPSVPDPFHATGRKEPAGLARLTQLLQGSRLDATQMHNLQQDPSNKNRTYMHSKL